MSVSGGGEAQHFPGNGQPESSHSSTAWRSGLSRLTSGALKVFARCQKKRHTRFVVVKRAFYWRALCDLVTRQTLPRPGCPLLARALYLVVLPGFGAPWGPQKACKGKSSQHHGSSADPVGVQGRPGLPRAVLGQKVALCMVGMEGETGGVSQPGNTFDSVPYPWQP